MHHSYRFHFEKQRETTCLNTNQTDLFFVKEKKISSAKHPVSLKCPQPICTSIAHCFGDYAIPQCNVPLFQFIYVFIHYSKQCVCKKDVEKRTSLFQGHTQTARGEVRHTNSHTLTQTRSGDELALHHLLLSSLHVSHWHGNRQHRRSLLYSSFFTPAMPFMSLSMLSKIC